jgi:hypothetical protein
VELSLRGYDEPGSKMKGFYDALERLDDFMIEQGVKNSKQWFKQDLNRDVIKAFYTPVVRIPLDKNGDRKPYPPTIKLALKQKRDSQDFDVQCYDDKKELYRGIPLEELLVKGAQVTCLIQCTGVWFAGSKYGLSWKLVRSIVTSLPQSAAAFNFVDDGELSAPSKSAPSKAAPPKAAPVEDEEEEDEEEEEEEDEVFTAPAKKPSVVAAVLPKAAPAPAPVESLEDAADDAEPVPVPKKTTSTIVKKKIVAKK